MKKISKLLIVIVLLMTCLSACEKDEFDVQYYTINRWTLSPDRKYYYADVSSSALTTSVYNNGGALGYLMSNFNTVNETQIPLPFDIYHINETGYTWTETLSFDMVPGGIRFYFEPSDFIIEAVPPVYTFKVVLMW